MYGVTPYAPHGFAYPHQAVSAQHAILQQCILDPRISVAQIGAMLTGHAPQPLTSGRVVNPIAQPKKDDGLVSQIGGRISGFFKEKKEDAKAQGSAESRMQHYLASICNTLQIPQERAQMQETLYIETAPYLELARLCDTAPPSLEGIATLKPEQAAYYMGRIQHLTDKIRHPVAQAYIGIVNLPSGQQPTISFVNLPQWIQACRVVVASMEARLFSQMKEAQKRAQQQTVLVSV